MVDASTGEASQISACPYLRAGGLEAAEAAADRAGPAGGADTRSCAAGRERFVPGPRQRSLVCESTRFESCPRYPVADRRGPQRWAAQIRSPAPWATTGTGEPAGAARLWAVTRRVSLPTAVASGILALALVAALAFAAVRGGLDLAAGPSPSAAPAPTAAGTPQLSPAATPGPTTPSPTTAPSPLPTATPESTPAVTPSPSVSPSPSTTPSQADPRYAGLKPCAGRSACFLYVVKRGDTLSSIAAHFAVKLAVVRALNPEIRDPSLIHAGQEIRVPAPG